MPDPHAGVQDSAGSGAARSSRQVEDAGPRALMRRRRWRQWAFRLSALLLIPALFFFFLEIGLRAAGTGYPTKFLVPVADKPGVVADNYRFAWRFFPRALARSPQPILITKDKPQGTIRIIVFGGSAAMGDPEPAYGLARLLEVMLESRFPHDDFQVLNAAVTAVNSHVVLSIVRDCRHLDADAWVVYLGNNEVHGPFGAGTVFGGHDQSLWLIRAGLALKRTRIGQVVSSWPAGQASSGSPKNWGGMEMFLEHQIRHDDPRLERVYANFRRNLTDIVNTAVREGTPVIISTVVTNLKDSPPFISLHHKGLSETDRQSWQSFFAAGCQAQSRGDRRQALEGFARAAEIDAGYAELCYRQGQCHLELGDAIAAHEKFRLARDHDALRFRADSTINGIIRSVAQQRSSPSVILVDASEELARQTPGGILGDELLHEHVHLNFAGNYRLARMLAETLAERLSLSAAAEAGPQTWPSEQLCADLLGLTTYHELLTLREMRSRLRSPPFNRQINHQQRDEKLREAEEKLSSSLTRQAARDAISRYRELIDDRPQDWVLRKQFSILLESAGDLEGAVEQFEQITNQLAHHPESLFRLGALLNRTRKWQEAERALRRALALRADFARAANSLGICLSHQMRHHESVEQFRRAVELQPTFAEAYLNWGLVLADQGDDVGARQQYTSAIAADPDYVPAHDRLGNAYMAAKDPLAAVPHYVAVVRLKPNDPVAHLNLGLLYLKIGGHRAEATNHLQLTLELDPGNVVAQQALGQLRQQVPAN